MNKFMTSKLIIISMIFVTTQGFGQEAEKTDYKLNLKAMDYKPGEAAGIKLDTFNGTEKNDDYSYTNFNYGLSIEAEKDGKGGLTGFKVKENTMKEAIDKAFAKEMEKLDMKYKDILMSKDYVQPKHNIALDYDCSPEEGFENFTELIKEANACFQYKRSEAEGQFSSSGAFQKLSQDELLKGDETLCNCLRDSKVDDIKKMMNVSLDEAVIGRSNKELSSNINQGLYKLMGRVATLRNAMLFQADNIFLSNKSASQDQKKMPDDVAKKLVSAYSGGFFTKSFNKGENRKDFLSQVATKLNKSSLQGTDRAGFVIDSKKRELNAQLKSQIEIALTKTSLPEPDLSLVSQDKFAEGQCVGPKEFMAINQIPNENEFYLSLMKEDYKEENWNYETLEKKLIALTPNESANKKEIETIEMRMKFLNRNPLLKNLMAANDDFDDYFKATTRDEVELKVLKDVTAKVLPRKKKELFDIMKSTLTPKNSACVNRENGCKWDIMKNVNTFDSKMKKFFTNKDVLLLTNTQAEKAARREIMEFADDPMSVKGKYLPLNQKELEEFTFNKVKTSSAHPQECNLRGNDSGHEGSRFDSYSCVSTYSIYCAALDKSKQQAAAGYKDDKYRAKKLKDDTEQFFNPNIDENYELRKFNEEYCNLNKIPRSGKGVAKSFNKFREDYCRENKGDAKCFGNAFGNIQALRELYKKEYTFAKDTSGKPFSEDDKFRLHEELAVVRKTQDTSRSDASKMASNDSRPSENVSELEELLGVIGSQETIAQFKEEKVEDPGVFANLATVMENSSGNMMQASVDSYDDGLGYSNMSATPSQNPVAEVPRIENMTEESKEEMLSQWKEEFEDWKKTKKGDSQDQSSETAMKAKIAALEALLADQRKVTNEQYKLLNEAIANQQKVQAAAKVAQSTAPVEEERKFKAKASSGFSASSNGPGDFEEVNRLPASIKDVQFNTSGSGSGSSLGSAQSRQSTRTSKAAASADSVAREEAKLVNLRRFSDGSITIESVGRGSQSTPNAITVPVSDEQYQLLASNPTALNLSQIEKNIPKDQMEKLEKSGQIILVLQNGSNPPFEVKVEKKDNKLVYQLKDNNGKAVNPVRRVYTRQALELQLRTQ